MAAIAGTVFAVLAQTQVTGWALISAVQLAPYLAIGCGITFLAAHGISRYAENRLKTEIETHPEGYIFLPGIPQEFQTRWLACTARNLTGYASLGIGGTILSIAIIAARVGLLVL